jgi:hypothetical protein
MPPFPFGLYVRLPHIDDLHRKLENSREGSMIPPYPAPQDLKKSTTNKNLFRAPLPLYRYYPGQIIKTEISLDLSQFLTRAFLPFGHLPGVNGPIMHGLQMLPLKEFQEESVKDQIRQYPGNWMLSALGLFTLIWMPYRRKRILEVKTMRIEHETGQSQVEMVFVTTVICVGIISTLSALNRLVEKTILTAILMISLPVP